MSWSTRPKTFCERACFARAPRGWGVDFGAPDLDRMPVHEDSDGVTIGYAHHLGGALCRDPSASARGDPADEGCNHDRQVELTDDCLQACREPSGGRDGKDIAEPNRRQSNRAEVLEDGD